MSIYLQQKMQQAMRLMCKFSILLANCTYLVESNHARNGETQNPSIVTSHFGYIWIAAKPRPYFFGKVPCQKYKNAHSGKYSVRYLQVNASKFWVA